MTDIVERLRRYVRSVENDHSLDTAVLRAIAPDLTEAADEVERLRALVDEYQTAGEAWARSTGQI